MNHKEAINSNELIEFRAGDKDAWSPFSFDDFFQPYQFRVKPKPPRFKVLYRDYYSNALRVTEEYYATLEECTLLNHEPLQLLESQHEIL